MTTPAPERRTPGQLVRHLAVLAIRLETAIWQSLYRFLLRRPRVPAGVTPFTYHRVVLPVIITFIVVSAIELVAVDLLVQRWPLVRIPLLILGIWGLIWMFGHLAAMVTREPDDHRARALDGEAVQGSRPVAFSSTAVSTSQRIAELPGRTTCQ